MNQDRLSNMALLYIERDLSSQLWDKLDDLVIRFAETHRNSKIVLSDFCLLIIIFNNHQLSNH